MRFPLIGLVIPDVVSVRCKAGKYDSSRCRIYHRTRHVKTSITSHSGYQAKRSPHGKLWYTDVIVDQVNIGEDVARRLKKSSDVNYKMYGNNVICEMTKVRIPASPHEEVGVDLFSGSGGYFTLLKCLQQD